MQRFARIIQSIVTTFCRKIYVGQAKVNHRQRNTKLTAFTDFHKLIVERFCLFKLVAL